MTAKIFWLLFRGIILTICVKLIGEVIINNFLHFIRFLYVFVSQTYSDSAYRIFKSNSSFNSRFWTTEKFCRYDRIYSKLQSHNFLLPFFFFSTIVSLHWWFITTSYVLGTHECDAVTPLVYFSAFVETWERFEYVGSVSRMFDICMCVHLVVAVVCMNSAARAHVGWSERKEEKKKRKEPTRQTSYRSSKRLSHAHDWSSATRTI